MTLHPVVVGVDGSDNSERALVWSVAYAKLSGAPLRVICAWRVPGTFGGAVSYTDAHFHQPAAGSRQPAAEDVAASVETSS